MYKLKKYYYANKEKIWKIIILAVFILILIKIWQHIMINENQTNQQYINNSENIKQEYNEINIGTNKELTTGQSYNSDSKEELNVIDEFFKYINNENYAEAYNLITDDCKQEMFKSEEIFQKSYVSKIKEKGNKNSIEVNKWSGNTYRVNIYGDILAAGKVEEMTIEDYITVVGEKININNFIGSTDIYGKVVYGDFKLEVVKQKQYMNYTVISFKIANKTRNKYIIDELRKYDNMCIQDENGYKHIAYNNELTDSDVTIYPSEVKYLDIKYYLKNTTNINIEKVIFGNILESGENEPIERMDVQIGVKKVK